VSGHATLPEPTVAVRPLLRILKQELVLGQKLLRLGKAQLEVLIANDAARVSAIEVQSREISARQEVLERERGAAVQALARAIGLESTSEGASTYTLSQILTCLPPADAQKLEALRQQIITVSSELVAINDQNRRLLETALEYVRFSLNILTGLALSPPSYGANPHALAAPSFYLDRKA